MLRAKSERRIAVHYTPDAQILENRSRHFVESIPLYDLLVTTKPFELDNSQPARSQRRSVGATGVRSTVRLPCANGKRSL